MLVLALAVIRYFVVPVPSWFEDFMPSTPPPIPNPGRNVRGCQVRPAGWGAGIPALSRWATMRLFQADQMHVALVQLRNSLGPIFLLPYAPPVSRHEWVGVGGVHDGDRP